MKNENILKLLNLTLEEKVKGIFLSGEGELYIGYRNIPDNFTGEYKAWRDNDKICTHSFWKNGKFHGERKVWNLDGTLYI